MSGTKKTRTEASSWVRAEARLLQSKAKVTKATVPIIIVNFRIDFNLNLPAFIIPQSIYGFLTFPQNTPISQVLLVKSAFLKTVMKGCFGYSF